MHYRCPRNSGSNLPSDIEKAQVRWVAFQRHVLNIETIPFCVATKARSYPSSMVCDSLRGGKTD